MSEQLVYPLGYRLIKREVRNNRACWCFPKVSVFYNPTAIKFKPESVDIEACFGTSKSQVMVECFRVAGGKLGYYLVDLIEKRYYYCGTKIEGVKEKLRDLGIGAPDPMDN